jgi:uncharacterized protein YceK
MRKFLLLSFIALALLSSCSTSRKASDAKEDALLNQWLKQPKSLLIQQWGQPDSLMSDGRNGEVLIYKEGVDFLSVMNERYTGKQYSPRKEMYVNADSTIYYWRVWRRK